MREIITLHVGGCGNAIAQEYWGVICGEHGINAMGQFTGNSSLQRDRLEVLFNDMRENLFQARAILIDTDPESIDKIFNGPLKNIFTPQYAISSKGGSGNNFAKAYSADSKFMESIMDVIRQEAEKTDTLQGFQHFHSMGGGTGTGLSSILWEHLSYNYPKTIISTTSIVPSINLLETIVEPYNCLLALPSLICDTQLSFCIDNGSLYDICIQRLDLCNPSYRDANHLIAHAMSGVSACLRFPGQLNSNLRKLYVNICPFPNLHFLIPGFSPLTSIHNRSVPQTVPDLVQQLFSKKSLLADVNFCDYKLITVAAIFRGLVSSQQVDTLLAEGREKYLNNFVNWLPNNIKTAICDVASIGLDMSATFIGNSTGFCEIFRNIQKSFDKLYQRKAYLHVYTDEGIEEDQFVEAEEKLNQLIAEYDEAGMDNDINYDTEDEREQTCACVLYQ